MFTSILLAALSALLPSAGAEKIDAAQSAGHPAALAVTPYFHVLSVADGLPSNRVYKIVEDHDGYIWVGTHDGLARYDGAAFRVWRHDPNDPDSLSSDDVPTLYVDRDNRIWCGGEDGLSMLDVKRERFVHFRHDDKDAASLSANDVWAINGEADGTIWVGGYTSGLDRLVPGAAGFTHIKRQPGNADGLSSNNVLGLFFDHGGRLWVGTDAGLDVLVPAARKNDTSVRHVDFSAVSSDGRFNAVNMLEEADGSVLVASRHGLLRVDAALKARTVADSALSDSFSYALVRDARGELWIANRRGLNRMDMNGHLYGYKENAAVPGSLPGTVVFDAMRDHEGGLWFATLEGGIARLSPQWQNFALFRNDPGNPSSLQVNHVKGLAADASGAIWVVNSTGGIDRFDPATDRVEHLGERLQAPDRSLWSVLPDRNGQVWVGSTNALRVFDLRSAKFQDLPFDAKRRDALAPGLVFHIIQADSGAIWVNSFGAALHRIDPLTHAIERFDANNAGLRNAEVDQIGFDREGNLLAASAAGLDRFDATMQRFSPVPGAPTARVLEFAFVADATVWLHLPGALEHYRWDATGLHLLDRVDTKSGWPALTVGGMQVDSSGAVWVSSPRGLWRFDPATRAVRVFDAHDGLGSLEFTRMPLVKRRDGSIFGGTEAAGIVGFVPEQVAENATPPLLAPIEAVVRRNGHDIALDTATNLVDLRWDDRDLRIHAHALSYANPLGNRYQWKLGGLDSGWIDTGNHGEREFAQLPPGRHHLNLRAANASGVWTQATPILFEQASPPWATRWAYAAYVLAMVLAAWLVLQSYRKRLKRRHALELAEQQRRFAEQASAAKSDFLATMGHEIRTPMTGVLGMTELLLGTTLDAKQRGYAEAIQTSGNMMLRLVNDSLDLARIEAGKLELEDAGVDLHALVGEIAALAQTLAQRKGLVFTHSIAADAPRWVRGDAVRIKQIFLNLVNNAIKFTERGSVAFDLARAPSGATQFAVRDTGPGIAESTRQRLFERFEQANGTQRRYGGSGLGLAICRELVARMGGTIELESGVGEGSRFVVTLPLAQMSDAEQPDPAAAPSPAFVKPAAGIRARSLRILLVEDDATVAAVISGLLEAQGHRVRHVAQGLAALSESGIEPFDVALLDLDLHGIDGLALARALRASEAAENRPRLPLIGVSARSAGDEEALCLAAGMDRFLRKPVTSALLAAALEQVVADKG